MYTSPVLGQPERIQVLTIASTILRCTTRVSQYSDYREQMEASDDTVK